MKISLPALFVVLTGCAPAQDTNGLIVSEDAELGAMASEVFTEVAERSGLAILKPVRVAKRSRAELQDYLRLKLDEELPPEEAEEIVAVYALLGLSPEDLDLREILLSTYLEQVAGFYEPDSTALFLVDDQPMEDLKAIVVHELVHALQDQHADLDALVSKEKGSDSQIAAQAAIEGHATLVMMEWTIAQQQRSVDLEDLPDFGAMIGPALAGVKDQYPALARAPRIIQEGMLYPYLEGAGFVLDLWKSGGGRSSPLAHNLPVSTEQVSHPNKTRGADRDLPLEVAFGGPEAVYENGLGYMEVGVLLEEWLGSSESRELAEGWGGDSFRLYGQAGSWSVRWILAWDDVASRDRFVTGTSQSLPPGAELVVAEVDGFPVTDLRVGGPPLAEVSVRVSNP